MAIDMECNVRVGEHAEWMQSLIIVLKVQIRGDRLYPFRHQLRPTLGSPYLPGEAHLYSHIETIQSWVCYGSRHNSRHTS